MPGLKSDFELRIGSGCTDIVGEFGELVCRVGRLQAVKPGGFEDIEVRTLLLVESGVRLRPTSSSTCNTLAWFSLTGIDSPGPKDPQPVGDMILEALAVHNQTNMEVGGRDFMPKCVQRGWVEIAISTAAWISSEGPTSGTVPSRSYNHSASAHSMSCSVWS